MENAAFEGQGVWLRGREHRWSAGRLSKRGDRLWWITGLAAFASASGFIAAVGDVRGFAWVAGLFAAASALLGDYVRRDNPDEKAREHSRAADRWEALYVDYQSFWRDQGPNMPEAEAAGAFARLEQRRAALISDSPAVEQAAKDAIKEEDAPTFE
jgi:hypothetical protein